MLRMFKKIRIRGRVILSGISSRSVSYIRLKHFYNQGFSFFFGLPFPQHQLFEP
jgi:hypothetical protein